MSAGVKAWRSSSGSMGIRTGGSLIRQTSNAETAETNVFCEFCEFCVDRLSGRHKCCRHYCLDSAPYRKISHDRHAAGLQGGDQIVKDLVRDVLVENAAVAEFNHVVLERFQLDAPRVGDVGDPNLAEVGETRLGTERRELRAIDGDLV